MKSSIIITTKVVIVIVAQAMHPKSVLLVEKHVILVIRKATLSHIADPGNGAKMVQDGNQDNPGVISMK